MTKSEIIAYKFPGGMNTDNTGVVKKIILKLNQKIIKGEKLAVLSSGNYEMEITAESDGITIELLVEENQVLHQNDIMWKVKTI